MPRVEVASQVPGRDTFVMARASSVIAAVRIHPFERIFAGIADARIDERMHKSRAAISVLVVDDDRDARAMYRMYLMHVGCKVRTARDGHVAITKANTWTPDVIVMDLAMPRLDGWSASRRLKSSPTTAHIPIIALSAASEAREDARDAGCDGFLAKPCQPDLLWWEIRALLHPEA